MAKHDFVQKEKLQNYWKNIYIAGVCVCVHTKPEENTNQKRRKLTRITAQKLIHMPNQTIEEKKTNRERYERTYTKGSTINGL